jgi:hypothetical protein
LGGHQGHRAQVCQFFVYVIMPMSPTKPPLLHSV